VLFRGRTAGRCREVHDDVAVLQRVLVAGRRSEVTLYDENVRSRRRGERAGSIEGNDLEVVGCEAGNQLPADKSAASCEKYATFHD
jgi:hypothetical protein